MLYGPMTLKIGSDPEQLDKKKATIFNIVLEWDGSDFTEIGHNKG
jgi:hypothetical protein